MERQRALPPSGAKPIRLHWFRCARLSSQQEDEEQEEEAFLSWPSDEAPRLRHYSFPLRTAILCRPAAETITATGVCGPRFTPNKVDHLLYLAAFVVVVVVERAKVEVLH